MTSRSKTSKDLAKGRWHIDVSFCQSRQDDKICRKDYYLDYKTIMDEWEIEWLRQDQEWALVVLKIYYKMVQVHSQECI